MANRVGGIIQVQANGERYDAKGDFDYALGIPKKEGVVGSDRVHGYKEMPQIPYIEGKITDRGTLDVAAMQRATGLTITVALANGKTVMLRDAWYASEGKVNTGEGEIDVRWEGMSAEEVKA